MFDNLRDDSSKNAFEEPKSAQFQPAGSTQTGASRPKQPPKFLGMTAPQRFVISFMVMVAVFVLGLMCLLITGKLAI